ncbi:transcriptional regulator [Flavobacterium sp.]|uniref:transcriptional regulator n=1 Tax=Flavobacterium sp. TaxID=239 RepID=UPI0039E70497
MNYIKHLTGFFDKVAKDKLLNPTHVSLYIALFQFWNIHRFRNPISISRQEIMRISKISSLATYHRCLKLLDAHGYIKYEPSFNPYKGSQVFLFNFADDLKPTARNARTATSNFESATEQAINKHDTSNETTSEQVGEIALVPYKNNTNNTNGSNISNSLNLGEQAQKNEIEGSDFLIVSKNEKEKSSAKKEKDNPDSVNNFPTEEESVEHVRQLFSVPEESFPETPLPNPTVEEVLKYFSYQNYPEVEANKFYNYFKSIGWLVGGKIPMTDWPAAARNWMLNAPKFTTNERTDRTKSFDTSADKDYSEPL